MAKLDFTTLTPEALQFINRTVHRSVLRTYGLRNSCILSSRVLLHVLHTLGQDAYPLRVEVVGHSDNRKHIGCIMGSDGDGIRRKAKPGMWNGHLTVVALGQYLVDPTIDSMMDSQPWMKLSPLVATATTDFLAGDQSLFVQNGNVNLRYTAFPGRGGFKSAPAFRNKWYWMPVANSVLRSLARKEGSTNV